MKTITLLLFIFSNSLPAVSEIAYYVNQDESKIEYFYMGKKKSFTEIKKLLKALKGAIEDLRVTVNIHEDAPMSEFSKHIELFRELKIEKMLLKIFKLGKPSKVILIDPAKISTALDLEKEGPSNEKEKK